MMPRILTVLIVLTASSAQAEPSAKPKEVTQYSFDDDLVSGDLLTSDWILVPARSTTHRSSLIDVRTSFVPELLKNAEDL